MADIYLKGRDIDASVRNLFRGSHEFALCDTAKNREELAEIALACSDGGRLELNWSADETDIDSWVHDIAAGKAMAPFRLWAQMRLFDADFRERHMRLRDFATACREMARSSGNRDLKSVFDKLDDGELLACLMIYGVVSVEHVIHEPSVRVNILFATDSEKLGNFSFIPRLSAGGAVCDAVGNSISDNAFSLLLESQGTDFEELLHGAGAEGEDSETPDLAIAGAGGKFLERARQEVADMRGSDQSVLIVCSEATPDQIFQILNSPFVQIGRGARIGLYNPWENTVSGLQMSLEKSSAKLPSSLIFDVQIEGAVLHCSMDFDCSHKHKVWRNMVRGRSS